MSQTLIGGRYAAAASRAEAPFRWIPTRPGAPWWREAMRAAVIGLTASWAAGEITLFLILR